MDQSRYQERRAAVQRRRRRIGLALGLVLLLGGLGGGWLFFSRPTPVLEVVEVPTATPTMTMLPATPTSPPTTSSIGELPTPTPEILPTATPVALTQGDTFFSPQRLSYAPDFYQAEIQALLDRSPGPLKTVRFQVGSRSQSFAETLVGLSVLYNYNPQIVLALAEYQNGLISGNPSADQINFAFGFQGEGGQRRGLYSQLRWVSIQLRHATRDYGLATGAPPPLVFADGSRIEVSADIGLSRYVLARALAPTTTPDRLDSALNGFLTTFTRLFDDPRLAPGDWPAPAEPFLFRPAERNVRVTSFFDHDAPFLQTNGATHTFWGRDETDIAFAYDGHTGWDYAMAPPDRVLAAADGLVIFAGHSDDGCGPPAKAVAIDHGNGYRTLYWHLDSFQVEAGQPIAQGDVLGVAGETGCAFGPHLHLQVQYLGRDSDPYGWCGANPDPWANNPVGQISVWLWADQLSPCAEAPPEVIVVDDESPGFTTLGEWQRNEIGFGGGSSYAITRRGFVEGRPFLVRDLDTPPVALWRPELPAAGEYRVAAYVPYALNGLDETQLVRFIVRHSGGEAVIEVNMETERNWWIDLGSYNFDPTDDPFVSVSAAAGERNRGVWADAVAFIPVPESEEAALP